MYEYNKMKKNIAGTLLSVVSLVKETRVSVQLIADSA